MGWHGVIEFGNRLLTFVLAIIALLTFITIVRLGSGKRTGLVWPGLSLGLGIVAQALLGGVTVLTGLNPWVVGAHFVVSGVLIAIASILVWRIYRPKTRPVSQFVYYLAWPTLVVGWVSILFGIVVTGAGPHAGDAATPRNGLDLEIWQHYHSYPAYLMLGLILLQLIGLWRVAALSTNTGRIVLGLFTTSVLQALIGVAQARLGVPPLLVGAHMLGASLIASLLTFNVLSVRSKA
jgi:cytochrome c oxidase assembly protein subunit 15